MATVNTVLSCFAGFLLWKVYRAFAPQYFSPLRALPGPSSPNPLYGDVRQVCRANSSPLTRQWIEKYGPNILTRWLFMIPCLWTTDLKAIDHILHSANYGKPWEARISAARIVGDSVLVAEGEVHRKQRRILNPAFGPVQIRELTGIFLEKAGELRDYWIRQIASQGEQAPVNIVDGLKKTTLDVIGLAGFDYRLDALNSDGKPNELNEAFYQIFGVTPPVSVYRIIMDFLPFLDFFPDKRMQKVNEAHKVMNRIGTELIAEKKAAILQASSDKGAGVAKRDVQGKDLLTLLIKANMATDVPDDQRLSDKEVFAQIPTFLVAGHETTSTATAWCLCALAQCPQVQQRLRKELLKVASDAPTMDELMALPYLDCVDDVIPVNESYLDRSGKLQHEIRIAKGNRVILPFLAVHQSRALWGDDVLEFKPERWENPPDAISSVPGVWGHMLTFSGGPHACIGYRFSLVELKALVFTLVRALEFELATPVENITTVGVFTQRPALLDDLAKGAQLPMRIRPYKHVD